MAIQKRTITVDLARIRSRKNFLKNVVKNFLSITTEIAPPNVVLSVCNFFIFSVQILLYLSPVATNGGLTYLTQTLNVSISVFVGIFVISTFGPLISRNFVSQASGFFGLVFYTLILLSGIENGELPFLGITAITYLICIILITISAMSMQIKVYLLKQEKAQAEEDNQKKLLDVMKQSLARDALNRELRLKNVELSAKVEVLENVVYGERRIGGTGA